MSPDDFFHEFLGDRSAGRPAPAPNIARLGGLSQAQLPIELENLIRAAERNCHTQRANAIKGVAGRVVGHIAGGRIIRTAAGSG